MTKSTENLFKLLPKSLFTVSLEELVDDFQKYPLPRVLVLEICCSLNYFETNLRLLNSFDSDMLFGCLIHYEDYEMDEFDSMFSFQLIMYLSLNINVWHRPDE